MPQIKDIVEYKVKTYIKNSVLIPAFLPVDFPLQENNKLDTNI